MSTSKTSKNYNRRFLILIATLIFVILILACACLSAFALFSHNDMSLSEFFVLHGRSMKLDKFTHQVILTANSFSLVTLLTYIAFILIVTQKNYKEMANSKQNTEYIYTVIRALSGAIISSDAIPQALSTISSMYNSENAGFFILKSDKFFHCFTTHPELTKKISKTFTGLIVYDDFPELYFHLLKGNCVVLSVYNSTTNFKGKDAMDNLSATISAGKTISSEIYNSKNNYFPTDGKTNDFHVLQYSGEVVSISMPRISLLKSLVSSLFLVIPCINTDGIMNGILVVAISEREREKKNFLNIATFKYLLQVSTDFADVANNIELYYAIKNMSSVDATTGLLNRNSYKQALEELEIVENQPFACIFVDVNGLHEINNTYGHEYGDHMLSFVADTLKKIFPEDEVFRIGGDEFIVFALNHSLSVIDLRVAQLNSMVIKAGYSISIGVEWRDHDQDVPLMVKEADLKMYAAKKRYYQTRGNRRKSR